jgi:hypothetical protein
VVATVRREECTVHRMEDEWARVRQLELARLADDHRRHTREQAQRPGRPRRARRGWRPWAGMRVALLGGLLASGVVLVVSLVPQGG